GADPSRLRDGWAALGHRFSGEKQIVSGISMFLAGGTSAETLDAEMQPAKARQEEVMEAIVANLLGATALSLSLGGVASAPVPNGVEAAPIVTAQVGGLGAADLGWAPYYAALGATGFAQAAPAGFAALGDATFAQVGYGWVAGLGGPAVAQYAAPAFAALGATGLAQAGGGWGAGPDVA